MLSFLSSILKGQKLSQYQSLSSLPKLALGIMGVLLVFASPAHAPRDKDSPFKAEASSSTDEARGSSALRSLKQPLLAQGGEDVEGGQGEREGSKDREVRRHTPLFPQRIFDPRHHDVLPQRSLTPNRASFSIQSEIDTSFPSSGNVSPDTSPAFLEQMDWQEEDLETSPYPVSLATLGKLLKVEMSCAPRWVSLHHFPQRLLYFPFLSRQGITLRDTEGSSSRRCCACFWMHGQAIPLQSRLTHRRAIALHAFGHGIKDGLSQSLNLSLLTLLGYQLTHATKVNLFDTFHQADHNSILGIANLLHKQPAYFTSLLAPVSLALCTAVWKAFQIDEPTLKAVEKQTHVLETFPQGFCSDTLRSLLPFSPIQEALSRLERLLLWEGRLPQEAREKGYIALETFTQSHGGYSQLSALHTLAHLVDGTHLRDYPLLKDGYAPETPQHFLSLKTRALQRLETLRGEMQQKKGCSSSHLKGLYISYLLWTLGQSPSWKTTTSVSLLKGGQFTIQALFFKMMLETLIQYFNCPERPGLSWNGYQPWSSSYSKECFDELVREFNTIPGQPAWSLVGNLTQYHFPNNQYALDLSGKGLEGSTVLDIIRGFSRAKITLTALDLSGNLVNKASIFQQMFPLLSSLRKLSLADNGIEDPASTSADTIVLAQGLRNMTSLTSLNLSHNEIGLHDSQGVVAIGNSLQYLSRLTSLDLSLNEFGSRDSQGVVVIGNNLQYLTCLTSFDLSRNLIGFRESQGAVAIADSLKYLTDLTFLDLSWNRIKWKDSKGIDSLAQGLKSLKNLQGFNIQPQEPPLNTAEIIILNQALAYTAVKKPIQLILSTWQDVEAYFSGIPPSITFLNLSALISNPQLMGNITNKLRNYPYLTTLDLSHNDLERENSNGTIALGNIFQYLPHLTLFDLSYNEIESSDSKGSVAIGNGLRYLKNLTSLNLSYNGIGSQDSQGAVAIGNSLKNLTCLTSLNLFGNWIGSQDSQGAVAIGNSLKNLTCLISLNLSGNWIGWTDSQGEVSLGNGLQYLLNLQILQLSYNRIGSTDKKGPLTILSALPKLQHLKTLDLSGMQNISWTEGAEALAGLNRQRLKQACEAELCFATPIPHLRQDFSLLSTKPLLLMQEDGDGYQVQEPTLLFSKAPSVVEDPLPQMKKDAAPQFSLKETEERDVLFEETEQADEVYMQSPLMTSAASQSPRPMGTTVWRWIAPSFDSSQSWFSVEAWLQYAQQAAYNLAFERDTHGKLINTMPAYFPHLGEPGTYDWALPTDETSQLSDLEQQSLNETSQPLLPPPPPPIPTPLP